MSSTLSKIGDKAEFLLKMQVPQSYRFKPGAETHLLSPTLHEKDDLTEADQLEHSEQDWRANLQRWKATKAQEGEFKSEAQLKNELAQSGSTRCLQHCWRP